VHASDIKMLLIKTLHARQHADTSYTERVTDACYFESNRRNWLHNFALCRLQCENWVAYVYFVAFLNYMA